MRQVCAPRRGFPVSAGAEHAVGAVRRRRRWLCGAPARIAGRKLCANSLQEAIGRITVDLIASFLVLTAAFAYLNARFMRLPITIGGVVRRSVGRTGASHPA